MKRTLILMFLVFTVATFIYAKGPMDKISLTTPAGQTIELTNRTLIEPISMAALEKFPNNITQPDVTGKGYELARAFKDGNRYVIFDRVRYFPAGGRGYVYYVGIENGWSEYDGKWFEASVEGMAAMNQIISQIRPITLTSRISAWAE